MDYISWLTAVLIGFLLCKFTTPKEISKQEEHLTKEVNQLNDDVQYYKKLTQTLVEENTKLRKQLNESH
jgi:regulator of replication initiation timing